MLKKSQQLPSLPRCDPDYREAEAPLATAAWVPREVVLAVMKSAGGDRPVSPIVLGQLWEGETNHLFVGDDDRHLVTLAGSRAGKGRSLVIPNLLNYPGSVVCIDPKGENAAVTARYRREVLGQEVVVLDPFAVLSNRPDIAPLRGSFNPFEWVRAGQAETIDEVAALADALVIRDNERDPHWNETARAFLKGVMLFVMSLLPAYDAQTDRPLWTLNQVRRLISEGLPPPGSGSTGDSPTLAGLLALMKADDVFDGAIAAAGHLLDQMGDQERGGVLSTLRRHTEFLESPAIATIMADSDFNPDALASTPTTIYLVLPEWRMGTHARWLRVMIASLLQALQRNPRAKGSPATLLLLDEFATLGHMESIERAAGYIAGFGVKLWVILQDLNQLKSLYKTRWETFLGNAGTLTAFGNVDVTTLNYLSTRLGETEVIRTLRHISTQEGSGETRGGIAPLFEAFSRGRMSGAVLGHDSENTQSSRSVSDQPSLQKTPLIQPDEIARLFAREEEAILVHLAGQQPFRLNRIRYDLDAPFRSRAAPSPYH